MPTHVSTGQLTIIDTNDGLNLHLTNQSHVVPTDLNGLSGNFTGCATTAVITLGSLDDSANWAVTATPSAGVTGSLSGKTYTVTAMSNDTGYVDFYASRVGYATLTARFTLAKAKAGAVGANAVVGVLSNESHLIPTDNGGNNGVFTGAATTMSIYNGAKDDSANWTVTASALIGVTGSLSGKTYTVTGMTVDTGYVDLTASRSGYSNVVKRFTLSKSKAGATGATGPAVVVTPSRPASFTSTDGVLDATQADIVFTAAVSGVASPTYTWAFSGLQTNPTASTTNTQTITAAQFGTAKSAIVTCTVGTYKDTLTIVRLEKSTAAAGATVGAPIGTYVGTTPAETVVSNASDGKSAYDAVNSSTSGLATKLGKASSEILNIATSGTAYVAGLRVGDLAWDSNGARTSGKGIALTPKGLVGHNGTATTFTVGVDGNATFAGSLSAARISVGSSANATKFFEDGGNGMSLLSTAYAVYTNAGTLTTTGGLGTVVILTTADGSLMFKRNDVSHPIERRIKNAKLIFKVSCSAVVDDQLSVWWRFDGGSWYHIYGLSEPQARDAPVSFTCTKELSSHPSTTAISTIEFGVAPCNADRYTYAYDKLYIKNLSLSIEFFNF